MTHPDGRFSLIGGRSISRSAIPQLHFPGSNKSGTITPCSSEGLFADGSNGKLKLRFNQTPGPANALHPDMLESPAYPVVTLRLSTPSPDNISSIVFRW